jgi:hypothetical protein
MTQRMTVSSLFSCQGRIIQIPSAVGSNVRSIKSADQNISLIRPLDIARITATMPYKDRRRSIMGILMSMRLPDSGKEIRESLGS